MINETSIQGVVTKTWKFGHTHFARVACVPDPGRTIKPGGGDEPEPEYITLRFEEPALAMAAAGTLTKGAHVRASGWLSSRDYYISLSRFVETAQGDEESLAALRELAEELCEERLVFTLEGGYHLDALAYSILNTFAVLHDGDTGQVVDPLGPSPRAERSVDDIIATVRQVHHLGRD